MKPKKNKNKDLPEAKTSSPSSGLPLDFSRCWNDECVKGSTCLRRIGAMDVGATVFFKPNLNKEGACDHFIQDKRNK
jgi:hypothetical protein